MSQMTGNSQTPTSDIEKEREAWRRRELARWWIEARVPRRYVDTELEPDSRDEYLAKADSIWTRLATGSPVLLTGRRGTGKTQLASVLIRRCFEAGQVGRYTRLTELYRELRTSFGTSGDTIRVLREYRKPDLLVIDEAHDVKGTDWERVELNDLIDYRYGMVKPTLIITNAQGEELTAALSRSILSRCEESGGLVTMTGTSFRSKA